MPQTCETRAIEARASRNSLVGCFRSPLNPCNLRPQFPMAEYRVEPGNLRAELDALPIYPGLKLGEGAA